MTSVERSLRQQQLWWRLFLLALLLAAAAILGALFLRSGPLAPPALRWAALALALALALGAWLLRSTQQAMADEVAAGESLRQAVALLEGKVRHAEADPSASFDTLPLPPSLQGLGAALEGLQRHRRQQGQQLEHLVQQGQVLVASLRTQREAAERARRAAMEAEGAADAALGRVRQALAEVRGRVDAAQALLRERKTTRAAQASLEEVLLPPLEAAAHHGEALAEVASGLHGSLGVLEAVLEETFDAVAEQAALEVVQGALGEPLDAALEALSALRDPLQLTQLTLEQRGGALAEQAPALTGLLQVFMAEHADDATLMAALEAEQASFADALALGEAALEGLAEHWPRAGSEAADEGALESFEGVLGAAGAVLGAEERS